MSKGEYNGIRYHLIINSSKIKITFINDPNHIKTILNIRIFVQDNHGRRISKNKKRKKGQAMKSILLNKKFLILFLLLFFASSVLLFGDQDGRTGRTLKTSTAGCGGCHGSAATTDVTVTINGPDSVNIGQQVQYTLTVSKQSKTGAGLDIATRRGTLAAVSSNIHLSNGELTHNNNIPMTSGSATVTFRYTAPGTTGPDTLWATGLATNSDNSPSGDDWNWAVSKRIIIRNPVGITHNTTLTEFRLSQNYPNPFNPVTKFDLSLQEEQYVTLKIFDMNGKEIYIIADKNIKAGDYTFEWSSVNNYGETVNSGVYFIVMNTGGYTVTRKMMLIK